MVNTRINGFDVLRAVAMWLGVVLHSIIVYKSEAEPNWPHENESYNALNLIYDFIHIFRMPLFYMVAGFFSCMVIYKSGSLFFVKQRARRILVPFIAGLIVIVPLSLFPFSFNQFYYVEKMNLTDAFQKSIYDLLKWKGMAHLWFLYYLLFFYAIAIVVVKVHRNLELRAPGIPFWVRVSSAFILLPAALSAVLIFFHSYMPPVYTGIKPNLFFLLYYGLFFLFGWYLFQMQELLHVLKKSGILFTLAGVLLFIVRWNHLYGTAITLSYISAATETCFIVLGITGLFIRYFNSESKTWRYFSDASYWVYLTHLFVVSSVQVLFISVTGIPSWFKLLIVLLTSFTVTMITYKAFVRNGIIGEYLHGKRNS